MARKGQPQDVIVVESYWVAEQYRFKGAGLRKTAGRWMLPGDVRIISAGILPTSPSLDGLVVGALHVDPAVWESGLWVYECAEMMIEALVERMAE